MEFSEKIKKVRKSLGLNQTEFARLVGLTQQTISGIETGTTKPSKTLERLIDYQFLGKNTAETAHIAPQSTISTAHDPDYAAKLKPCILPLGSPVEDYGP